MKTILLIIILTACSASASLAQDKDICDFCGKEIQKTVFTVTDKVTGKKYLICADCFKLPRCSICDLPVGEECLKLADGRRYCARDAESLVLKLSDASRICSQVEDDLDRLFSRFTSFPSNVDFSVIDKIDADSMSVEPANSTNTFERSDLLGLIRAETVYGQTYEQIRMRLLTGTNFGLIRYKISLLTGRPLAEFKATCAHELTHAWVGENVPPERKRPSTNSFLLDFRREPIGLLGHDAEEGFCEFVSYLLMDSYHEEGQKKAILDNLYTRGQTELFLEAENRYGFNDILDWVEYGQSTQLEAGHLEEVLRVTMPKPVPTNFITAGVKPFSPPATIKLEGIIWGNHPMATINGRSFFTNDKFSVKIGATNAFIRCLEIQTNSVRIKHIDSGREEVLGFGL